MEEYDEDYESDAKLAEYLVVPRPQELIQSQLKSSSKSKDHKDKSVLKEFLLRKEVKKSKEKLPKERPGKFKDTKESTVKASSSKKVIDKTISAQELAKKFESHLQEAKQSLSRYRFSKSGSSKPSNEDSEKLKHRSSSPAVEHSDEEQQLLKAMEEPAFSEQEKYDVLNARDSYIRLRDAKSGEPKSKVIFGTCPDMCPEKERYSRIAKNCLAVFEMKKGLDPMSNSKEVDHSYMIKEYSRSSADQQEPLPHELRPVPVLMSTMDYLICNIIDKIENSVSVADWYDFIWNRTRSIRKDITQQQLCDIECVDILEKCARFHILCAEALSEEDRATFDPKINNENLTKCLQTLKHMYHDLLSKGIQCPNEAEFRAYDILLSLTEGETLRLVKDIRKDIFKSPLVKSAFEAALALKSNNYVKFFKLMENATYLSSCIMHRYIHEARIHAIQVIIRAYSLQNNPTILPLSNLVKDLKFENTADAANFCRWHGLTADEEHVTIQRQTFLKPSDAYPITRATCLVQKKMKTGLGMIVNNGPLPENPLRWYQPQNSFNAEGILKNKIVPTVETADSSGFKAKDEVIDVAMEFDSAPVTLPSELISQQSVPISSTVTKSKKNVGSKISDFKVKTFEDFLNKSQNQTKKRDSFSFLSDDSFKSKSSFLKQAMPRVKSRSVGVLETADVKQSFVSKGLSSLPSVKKLETPSFVSPLQKSEKLNLEQFRIIEATPPNPKLEIPFKAPEKPLLGKSSFESPKSISQFATLGSVFSAKKENSAELNDEKDSMHTSVLRSPGILNASAIVAAKQKIELRRSISTDSFSRKLEAQRDLSGSHEFRDRKLDTQMIKKTHVPEYLQFEEGECDSADSNSIKKYVQKDDNAKAFIPETFKYDEDPDMDENSGMSSEDEETLQRMRDERINELILDVEDEIYSHCVEELSTGICEKVLNEEWDLKNYVDAYIQKTKLNLARKAIYKWKLFCERKKEREIYKNYEPVSPWLPMLINTAYVTSGATSPFTVYKKHCSLSRLTETKLTERDTKPGWEPFQALLFESLKKQPPLPPAYLQTTGITRFFKLGVVFASYPEDSTSYFIEWMFKKLKLPVVPEGESNKKNLTSIYTLHGGKTVIGIRAVVLGSKYAEDYNGFMEGMSAMILCCPAKFPDLMSFKVFLEKFSTLLKEANLLSTFPLFTFPLVSQHKCYVISQLASFLEEKSRSGSCFSSVKINQLSEPNSYVSNSREVEKAIKWLIENQEPVPALLSTSLQNYLEDSFASAFNTVFWKISLQEFKPLLMLPQYIIDFYNRMLDSRANLLCSEYLMSISTSWPPQELVSLQPEFRTLDKLFQKKASNLIKRLHLPAFNGDSCSLDDAWCYVRKVGGLSGNNAMLFISVQTILENIGYIDWPTIISKCAYYVICANCSNLMDELKDNVYYMKEDSDSLNFEPFWQSLLFTLKKLHLEVRKRKISESLEESIEKKRKEVEQKESSDTLKSIPDFGNVSIISSIPETTSCHVEDMLSSLKSALKKQNEESDKFLLKLNESVSGVIPENDQRVNTSDEEVSLSESFSISPRKLPNVDNFSNTSLKTSEILTSAGTNTWDKFVEKKTSVNVSTPASISEKLAELHYNIQKNNILEDNLSLLLNL